MTSSPAPEPPDHSEPPRHVRRRWFGATDENGEPSYGWLAVTDDEWFDTWPPCPDGEPVGLCHPLGFRERNLCELELRVLLGGDNDGVCQVLVDEQDTEVHVRVLVHRHDDRGDPRGRSRDYVDCPVRVDLERTLGDRAVIDADTDEELPLYTPLYLNNVIQADHGYRPVYRRGASSCRASMVDPEIN
jgi:hypothetical protein